MSIEHSIILEIFKDISFSKKERNSLESKLEKIDFVVQIYVIFILLDFNNNSPYQTSRRGIMD